MPENLSPNDMTPDLQPRIRALELVPLSEEDESMYALRDPYGFSETVALPMGAAMLVTLMNGERTLGDLRREFEHKVGKSISLPDVQRVVNQLDQRYMLDNQRFADYQEELKTQYKQLKVRPAAHAGGAYEEGVQELNTQLGNLFPSEGGPGLLPWEGNNSQKETDGSNPVQNGSQSDEVPNSIDHELCAVMSPHIDLHRGGPTFAWAYDRVVADSDADIYIILGTAHTPLASLFSVSQKHFDTPLGTVQTDHAFIADLKSRLEACDNASEVEDIFNDELPHRSEHSIEFQTLMLQYVLGERRNYSIVPILVGSFHPFVQHNRPPGDSEAVADFIHVLRETASQSKKKICFIAGVDLAHIGQQFGDSELLTDARLTEQWTDDQELLARACEGDAEAWFIHVAAQADKNRICGLAPMYVMLKVIGACRGELLKYDHAVADDRTSCVSFASVAFYK